MSRFLHSRIQAAGGDVIEVVLSGHAANVMLLTPSAFSQYQAGRQFSYVGGHYSHTPVRLAVPSAGTWIVVVDLGGGAGTVSASFRVLKT